jgi:hypothetical protein
MSSLILTINILPDTYSIYRFKSESEIPGWIYSSEFCSITKTKDEISVVASQADEAVDLQCNRDWRVLKIAGPLDFSLIGIVADVSTALSDKNIPLFIISTYDTDYILVKQNDLIAGIKALEEKGHKIQ